MSQLAVIQSCLSQKNIRTKLSLDERALLLIDITRALEWDTYENEEEIDLDKAKLDLGKTDAELIKIEQEYGV